MELIVKDTKMSNIYELKKANSFSEKFSRNAKQKYARFRKICGCG